MLKRLSCLLILAIGLAAHGSAGVAAPMLKGGVSLSEELPAVDADFMPGATFDPRNLPAIESHPYWIKIPRWLAGTWKTETETIINYKDVRTGRTIPRGTREVDIGTIVWGFQKDANGDIWHLTNTPGLSKTGGATADDFNYALSDTVEFVSELQVVRKGELQTYKVAHATEKILECAQQEQLQTYMPLRAGVVQIETELRVFSPKGQIEAKGHTRTLSNKSKDFEPLNGDDDVVKSSFEAYLRENGMADLVK